MTDLDFVPRQADHLFRGLAKWWQMFPLPRDSPYCSTVPMPREGHRLPRCAVLRAESEILAELLGNAG